MLTAIIIGIAAGISSAVLFISAASGSIELGSLMLLVVPLPIMLAGLGWGLTPMATAAIAGGLSVLAAFRERVAAAGARPKAPGTSGMLESIRDIPAYEFLLTQALPAMVLAHLVMLARAERTGQGDDVRVEWYPLGRVVAVASLLAGAVASWRLSGFGNSLDAVKTNIKTLFGRLFDVRIPGIASRPLTPEEIDYLITKIVAIMPIGLAVMWLVGMLINLWLAGRITLASGRLLRPWPEFSALAMPNGFAMILALSIAATWLGGLAGLFATAFVGSILAAFTLVGLAIVHTKSRQSTWRPFILATVYLLLILTHVWAAAVLALVALAEPMAPWNRNRAPPGEPPPAA